MQFTKKEKAIPDVNDPIVKQALDLVNKYSNMRHVTIEHSVESNRACFVINNFTWEIQTLNVFYYTDVENIGFANRDRWFIGVDFFYESEKGVSLEDAFIAYLNDRIKWAQLKVDHETLVRDCFLKRK